MAQKKNKCRLLSYWCGTIFGLNDLDDWNPYGCGYEYFEVVSLLIEIFDFGGCFGLKRSRTNGCIYFQHFSCPHAQTLQDNGGHPTLKIVFIKSH